MHYLWAKISHLWRPSIVVLCERLCCAFAHEYPGWRCDLILASTYSCTNANSWFWTIVAQQRIFMGMYFLVGNWTTSSLLEVVMRVVSLLWDHSRSIKIMLQPGVKQVTKWDSTGLLVPLLDEFEQGGMVYGVLLLILVVVSGTTNFGSYHEQYISIRFC